LIFYALDEPSIIIIIIVVVVVVVVLLSLDRTEYFFSLRVQYGKLKTNEGKQSWL
jgi:hypothetical protein